MIRRPYYLLLPAILLMAACYRSGDKLPLPEAQVVPLLADVHIAEGALQTTFGSTRDSLRRQYYHEIYQIHQTDSQTLALTLQILRKDPILMEKVYRDVLAYLEDLERG